MKIAKQQQRQAELQIIILREILQQKINDGRARQEREQQRKEIEELKKKVQYLQNQDQKRGRGLFYW